jgi:hypothetical protein
MVIESDESYVDNSISQLTDHDSDSAINSNMSNDSNNNDMDDDVNNNDNDKVYDHILSNVQAQASPALSTRSRLLLKDSSTSKKKAPPKSPSPKTVSSTKKRSSLSGSQQKSKQAKHNQQQQSMKSTSKALFFPKKKDIAPNNPLFSIDDILANKKTVVNFFDKAHDKEYMNTLLGSVYAAKTICEQDTQGGGLEDKAEYYDLQNLFDKKLIITVPRGGKATTKVWDYFRLPIYTKFGSNYAQTHFGRQNKLVKALANKNYPVVCCVCWKETYKPAHECIYGAGDDYNVSNLNTHIKHMHKDIQMKPDTQSVASSTTKSGNLLTYMVKEDDAAHVENAYRHLYHFFNTCNIAVRQADNEHLNNFIDFMISHGQYLKKSKNDFHFSRFKYKKQEKVAFGEFLINVSNIINFSKDYYTKKLNVESCPFIAVAHDGWDSQDNDILGVSIHFIIPEFWKVCNIAIGLQRVTNKKSISTTAHVFNMLKR